MMDLVAWNSEMPTAMEDALSDVRGSTKDLPASICISPIYRSGETTGQSIRFENLWVLLAYELNNVAGVLVLPRLLDAAAKGTIPRAEFIEMGARLEYTAIERTQQFYDAVWIPWARHRSFLVNSRLWTARFAPTFAEWLSRYPPDSEYPWKFYGRMYDEARTEKPR